MKRTTRASGFERFFQNDHGQWVVIQQPNALLWTWLLLMTGSYFIRDTELRFHVSILSSAVLFAWAYLEMTDGDSTFRKLLGFIVLCFTIIGFFTR